MFRALGWRFDGILESDLVYGNLSMDEVLFMHERFVSMGIALESLSLNHLVTKTIPCYVSRDPITHIPSLGSSSIQVNHKSSTPKAVQDLGRNSLNDHLTNEFEYQRKQHRITA